jgi:Zn-dependent protease with chaperone function
MLASLVIKLEYGQVLGGGSTEPAVPAFVCSAAKRPLEPSGSQQFLTETSHFPGRLNGQIRELNHLVTYRKQTLANCSNRQKFTFCNTLNLHAKTLVVLLAIFTVSLFLSANLGARSLQPLVSARTPTRQRTSDATQPSVPSAKPQPDERKITAYTLPPETYRKARELSQIHFRMALIGFVYGLLILWLVLQLGLAPKYRDWAEQFSSKRFVQAMIFGPLFFITLGVLSLPIDIYEHQVSRRFGISVQSWSSWVWDWAKGQFLGIILGIVLISILYAVIRSSPRAWWFYFWLVLLPIVVLLVFLQPLVVDPMFHKFEPLSQKDPALTAALEQMVQRAGQTIPPERMFWMGAGEKTTALNAYVTGLGASKRMVVWDTTIAKMTTPQIVFVAGHEMGHYVLEHIWKGMAFAALILFILFYLGYRTVGWVLARWGSRWGIRGLDEWASLPVLLLLLSIFGFIANPIASAFSRHIEHQADQYGLEVTHGLTPDSAQTAAQSFQILGEVDLSDPEPNPIDVFLFYSHPPIPDRIQFALTYNAWANGGSGEFVK